LFFKQHLGGKVSRGAGKIEQAITKSFLLSVGKSFTVEDLFHITYPEAFKIERKHRVSINRAASNVCERTGWDKMRRDNRGGGLIYFDPCDVISYASARLKCSEYRYQSQDKWVRRYNPVTDEQIFSQLEPGGKIYDLVTEGGTWWRHTEMARAKRDEDGFKYNKLKQENDLEIEAWASAFKKII
jgi:hypothetical protein